MNETGEIEASTKVVSPVDALVMQKCSNCAEWQGAITADTEKGDCLERDKLTYGSNTCSSFNPDPSRFCAICGAIAEEAEHSAMNCTKNDNHGASQWDYEWHDFSV